MKLQSIALSNDVALLSDLNTILYDGLYVLDQNLINKMIEQGKTVPVDYIKVPDIDQTKDLTYDCKVENVIDKRTELFPGDEGAKNAHAIVLSSQYADKSYIDIIFQSLRSLQAEVARLRNTMRYGMYSYTDTRTAMGTVLSELCSVTMDEPLWAIEESDLSYIEDAVLEISEAHTLLPRNNVSVHTDSLEVEVSAYWKDDLTKAGCCKNVEDAKLFLYLTMNTMNSKIVLKNINDANDDIVIDLRKLMMPVSDTEKYNVMIAVSRAYNSKKSTGDVWYGENYIWITALSWATYSNKREGYWNVEYQQLQGAKYIIGDEETKNASRYYFDTVEFYEDTINLNPLKVKLLLYKFNMYSRYLNFSTTVDPSTPSDLNYKYEVAHITIRSVENETVILQIIKQLPRNELIYNLENNSIYIVNEIGKYKKISGGGQEESGMTQAEITEWMKKNGIYLTNDGGGPLSVNYLTVEDITFINNDTGKKFKFTCDPTGKLTSKEIRLDTLAERIISSEYSTSTYTTNRYRGFVSNLRRSEEKKEGISYEETMDAKLCSDRVKIGAIYAPNSNRSSYGCSHAYIELENTSDSDIVLDGCYLHYAKGSNARLIEKEYILPLKGVLPANGTFVIRGTKYAEFDDPNCIIKVDSYDQEWYVSKDELIDFTLAPINSFLLVYNVQNELKTEKVYDINTDSLKNTFPIKYKNYYIDSVSIGGTVGYNTDQNIWQYSAAFFKVQSVDCIYKNTFELDPAKQAFQALTTKDSSRIRNNSATDYQYVLLNNDKIEFPKTEETYPVDRYTPKASKDKKNVCTDKTKLDMKKPNMVTCSFGKDIFKTRCFNWITTSSADEFVWLRKKNETEWSRFESYKGFKTATTTISFEYVEDKKNTGLYSVADIKDSYEYPAKYIADDKGTLVRNQKEDNPPVYEDGHYVINAEGYAETAEGKSDVPTYTINYTLTYNKYDGNDSIAEGVNISKKHFGVFSHVVDGKTVKDTIESVIYDRMSGVFPGCNVRYVAHKCIVEIEGNDGINSPVTYEYVVGRANKNDMPDADHSSDVQTFTIYPKSYDARIFQISDLQGFHWIEYQVWSAAAQELNKTISKLLNDEYIIPILINTGDMTQNGTRINEWLDYYNAGKCLFDHLEQMNVVGNNDLCDADPSILGTGDDEGKSNGYYFHVFYCYEVDIETPPIINSKYVPSLYQFEIPRSDSRQSQKIIMINSEITHKTCELWYNAIKGNDVINVYTGWPITSSTIATYAADFTTIYTMIYNMMYNYEGKIIAVCHEMPFTVITNKNLKTNINIDRSLDNSDTGNLVGSHLNKLNANDVHSNYWFSRLLEYFGVKLCLGGHKHTYACTNPIRELYKYKDGNDVKCSIDGIMEMPESLQYDTIVKNVHDNDIIVYQKDNEYWSITPIEGSARITISGSKYPLMQKNEVTTYEGLRYNGSTTYPCYSCNELTNGVVYFMLLATGFKLKSNKELPSTRQTLAYIIPETLVDDSGAESPSENQQYPMFAEIDIDESSYDIYLYRVHNIMDGTKLFSQLAYSTKPCTYQYLEHTQESAAKSIMFGKWSSSQDKIRLISVNR